MTAEFIALADVLRGAVSHPAAEMSPAAEPATGAPEPDAVPAEGGVPDTTEIASALRDARLFRARLADALDEAAGRLLRDLATDVLARELRLAPCDLARIVRRVGAGGPVVRVRVAPADSRRLTGVTVLPDSALSPGDAIVEVGGGALDARLGVRLAAVLEAFA